MRACALTASGVSSRFRSKTDPELLLGGGSIAMDFGITIKPDISIDRILSLTRQAESSGFSFGWIFDSHVIWKEPFPLLTLMAANTKKMRLGTCVTNPAVRDVTVSASLFAPLNLACQRRMDLGTSPAAPSPPAPATKPTTPHTTHT